MLKPFLESPNKMSNKAETPQVVEETITKVVEEITKVALSSLNFGVVIIYLTVGRMPLSHSIFQRVTMQKVKF